MSFFSEIFKGGTSGVFEGLGEFGKDIREIITGEPNAEKKLAHMEKIIAWGQQEARHKSIFVAGWRPFIGWICGIGLGLNIIIHPLFLWLNGIFWQIPNPPEINAGLLVSILTGMLGMSGIRSFDKKGGKS